MKKVEEKNSLMNQDHHQYDIDVTNDKVAIMNVSKPKSPYKGNDSLSKSPTDFTMQNKNVKLNNSPEKGKINRTNLRLNIKPTTNQQNAVTTLSPNTPGQNTTPKPINVVVFLKEGTDYKLWLEKGKLTTAEEIKLMMMKELSVPDYAKHFFAIWLISPHLELQLKGHHIPFLLRVQWHDLLSSLSYCEEQEAILDEPVLVFQRSSFLSEKEEEKNSDEVVVKRLFEEARYNILNARYPVPVSDAEWLGGILAHIEEGPYKESVHKPGCFKNSLSKYLPYYAIGSNKVTQRLNWSTTESHLLNQYKQLNDKNQQECKKMFLSYCQRLPFYGCAFFKGSFRMNEKTLWKNVEKSIKIGINRLGLSIFKSSKEELIRFLPYDDISWGLLCKEDENDIDSLCLEFDCGKEHAQQIFIDSKQAKMMDAMVESCVKYMDKLKIPKTPGIDYSKLSDINYPCDKKSHFSLSGYFKTV